MPLSAASPSYVFFSIWLCLRPHRRCFSAHRKRCIEKPSSSPSLSSLSRPCSGSSPGSDCDCVFGAFPGNFSVVVIVVVVRWHRRFGPRPEGHWGRSRTDEADSGRQRRNARRFHQERRSRESFGVLPRGDDNIIFQSSIQKRAGSDSYARCEE